MNPPAGSRILIIGIRRTGKSTLALFLAIDSGARFINHIDTMADLGSGHEERMKWRQMWLREYGYL